MGKKANRAKLVQPPTCIRTGATRKVCRVLVIGDSLLRGTKAPICHPGNISREVCCLPGARICDVMERLLSPEKPVDYHLFLLSYTIPSRVERCCNEATQKYEKRLYVPWNNVKGIGSTGDALYPPSRRRGFEKKNTN